MHGYKWPINCTRIRTVLWECVGGGFNMSDPTLRGSAVNNPAFVLNPSVLGPGQVRHARA